MILHTVTGKKTPSIYDWETEYENDKCNECGNIKYPIKKLGTYFPSWKKEFGLIHTFGGLIGSQTACNYLIENEISNFSKKEVKLNSAKYKFEDTYYWIFPKTEIEFDESNNSKILSICKKCGYRNFSFNNLFMPKYKNKEICHISILENSLFIIVDDYFKSLMKNIPGKSYLDFNEWFTENTHQELMEKT